MKHCAPKFITDRIARLALTMAGGVAIVALLPSPAAALTPGSYAFCCANSGFGSAYGAASRIKHRYESTIFHLDIDARDGVALTKFRDEWDKFVPSIASSAKLEWVGCPVAATERELQLQQERAKSAGDATYHVVDWAPSQSKPDGPVRSLTLEFEPGDGSGFLHARRGYRRASITLNYRLLLCADEIQIAYALDRRSLEHSEDYVDKFVGLNPNTMVPATQPPVPMSVPLAMKIFKAEPGTPYVATIRDATVGEALGMSCFTGQTARVGFVTKLIGAQATRPQIKAYLAVLRAEEVHPGASLGYALLNPDVPVPPPPPQKASAKRKPG